MYEIYKGRPFVSNVHIDDVMTNYYHARVCKGYKKDSSGDYLRIADPSRLNILRKDRWENWDDAEYTSDVFIR